MLTFTYTCDQCKNNVVESNLTTYHFGPEATLGSGEYKVIEVKYSVDLCNICARSFNHYINEYFEFHKLIKEKNEG